MKVRKRSILNGAIYEMDLDVTEEQLERYSLGIEHVQDVFPNLSVGEKEFIKSGITPKQWEIVFGKGPE